MRVEGVCASPKQLEKRHPRHGGISLPTDRTCRGKRRIVRCQPPVLGVYPVFTHSDCICNEIIAIHNRVLGVTPDPTDYGINILRKSLKRLARCAEKVVPITHQQFVDTYTGRRRARYQQAADELQTKPFSFSDAKITAFVKAEKFDPFAKINPDPRVIQFRSPRYNVLLGSYLKPMEKNIYKLRGPTGLRCIAKGLNNQQRAILLKKKMELFEDPVVVPLDGSRWDKHIHSRVLELEHKYYSNLCEDPFLDRLLKCQLKNKCYTNSGIVYEVDGNRMSGDMNTALGNCLLMVAMCYAAMRELVVLRWDLLDDGDDCLLIVERSELSKLSTLPNVFLAFGQELTLGREVGELSGVVFCQSKVVHIDGVPRFVRDWKKVLSGAAGGFAKWNDGKLVRPMLKAIGDCELALNQGVPILEAFARACLRNSHGASAPKGFADDDHYNYVARGLPDRQLGGTLDFAARESFAEAFDVSPEWQEHIEGVLERWTIDTTCHNDVPSELDYRWELNVHPQFPDLLESCDWIQSQAQRNR